MMSIHPSRVHLLAIVRFQSQRFLDEIFVFGFLPGNQRHSREEGGGPIANVVKAFREVEEISVRGPGSRFWLIGQPLDVTSRFADAEFKYPLQWHLILPCFPWKHRFFGGVGSSLAKIRFQFFLPCPLK